MPRRTSIEFAASRSQLIAQLRAISPNAKERPTQRELFVLWFLLSYVTDDNLEEARQALVGGSGDGGVDAIYVDKVAKVVYVIQGKLRDRVMARNEPAQDVKKLTRFAAKLRLSKSDLVAFLAEEKIQGDSRSRLLAARDLLVNRRYGLRLCYATLWDFHPDVKKSAGKTAAAYTKTEVRLIDGDRVLQILANYLDGVVQVPTVKLAVPRGTEILTREDGGLEARVMTMSALDIAQLVRDVGEALFARNIRLALSSKVSAELKTSAGGKRPELFWYLNNGITMLCDEVLERQHRPKGRAAQTYLEVTDAQIINGQQTARALRELLKTPAGKRKLRRVNVVMRVMRVPREGVFGMTFEGFVSKVVKSTNWQNAIASADLVANDQSQVMLERKFRRFGIEYLRKKGRSESKARASKRVGAQSRDSITKEELAAAVAGCLWESLPLREGTDVLFEDRNFSRIFRSEDPYFYLSRYWVARTVKRVLSRKTRLARRSGRRRGGSQRNSMRWPLVFFLWRESGQLLDRYADRFHDGMKVGSSQVHSHFHSMVGQAADAAYTFYIKKRVGESDAIDDFFKRDHLDPGNLRSPRPSEALARFWESPANARRFRAYAKAASLLEDDLEKARALPFATL